MAATAALLFAISRGTGGERVQYQRGLVVGDSHSRPGGVGPKLAQMLTEGGIPTQVVSHPGRGTSWFVSGRPSPLSRALAQNNPDLLVVILGSNDAHQARKDGLSPSGRHRTGPLATREATYKAALVKFVKTAKAAGVKHIVWVGPSKMEDPPRGGASRHGAFLQPAAMRVASWQREVLAAPVEWHDSHGLTRDLPTRDGLHFNTPEAAIWANRIASRISPLRS